MTNTRRTTWAGSLFTWRPLVLAEEAPLQEEAVAVETWFWREIALIRNPAQSFVPRPYTKTAMQVCLFTEDREKPLKMVRWWARFTTTRVIMQNTEEVKYPILMKASSNTPGTSASAAAERDDQYNLFQLLLLPRKYFQHNVFSMLILIKV